MQQNHSKSSSAIQQDLLLREVRKVTDWYEYFSTTPFTVNEVADIISMSDDNFKNQLEEVVKQLEQIREESVLEVIDFLDVLKRNLAAKTRTEES